LIVPLARFVITASPSSEAAAVFGTLFLSLHLVDPVEILLGMYIFFSNLVIAFDKLTSI